MPKQSFTPITQVNGTPLANLTPREQLRAVRTNALGSLYYFIKVPLRRSKLTDNLHLPLCKFLEREHLKDLIEWPRDHFKSTMASEGLVMWRALPFTSEDAEEFYKLGYSDDFIAWMSKSHNPNARSLIVSENKDNASKLGRRIRFHFESNPLFRGVFSDIIPDSSCKWDTFSMTIKRPSGMGGAHGEGTFDFIGVGGALQSRHYGAGGLIIQDDLVGRKAIESQTVMDKTIQFHNQVTALFEEEDAAHEGDELIIGNRWSYNDLNSHTREHEPWYQVTSHSALGGCCPVHPPDTPILPSVFSYDKLMRKRQTLGSFQFSCQFLNNPSAPENAEFKESDVNWFYLKDRTIEAQLNAFIGDPTEAAIVHEVKDGVVRKNVKIAHLAKCLVTDPNHSGNNGSGRCRHAIVVVGLDFDGNYYLLDSWAMGCSYDTYFGKLYELAKKWRITKVGFETVAAQKFAAYHLGHLNKTQPWKLKIVECKGEVQLDDGTVSKKKKFRIHGVIAPILESGRFFMLKSSSGQIRHQDFLSELTTFSMSEGGGRYLDQLDAWAYVPQVLKAPQSRVTDAMRLYNHQQQMKNINRPYVSA